MTRLCRLPHEQRDLRRRSAPTASSPPATAARRSSWPGSRPSPSARRCIVLPKGLKFEYPGEPEVNYIDTLVADKLKKLRIAPSDLCTDEVFLRRVYLDIVGLPPTVEEYDRFMASTDPDKRAKLIDELLERKEFSEIWVNKWAELLQVKSSIADQLQGDVPVLQLAGREALQEHADGPDGPGAARGQRRHVQEPGDQLLPGDDRAPWR